MSREETYYDVLKVDRKATVTEIVAAYHAAKNTFAKDSVATYSLISPEEAQAILEKLEEAYQTLSNLDKKREYDRLLALRDQNLEVPSQLIEFEIQAAAASMPAESATATRLEKKSRSTSVTENIPLGENDIVTGDTLKQAREKHGLTIEEVARTTKIPSRIIVAIENHDTGRFPARVYLQGFIAGLASLYRMDPKLAAKKYLEYIASLELPKSA